MVIAPLKGGKCRKKQKRKIPKTREGTRLQSKDRQLKRCMGVTGELGWGERFQDKTSSPVTTRTCKINRRGKRYPKGGNGEKGGKGGERDNVPFTSTAREKGDSGPTGKTTTHTTQQNKKTKRLSIPKGKGGAGRKGTKEKKGEDQNT